MKNQEQPRAIVLLLAGALIVCGSCKTNTAKRHSIDPKKVKSLVFEGPPLVEGCKIDDMTFNVGDKYCLIGEGEPEGECFICQQDGGFSNTHEVCSETKSCSTASRR